MPDLGFRANAPHGRRIAHGLRRPFAGQFLYEPVFFFLRQPRYVPGRIEEDPVGHEGTEHRRQPFTEEDPLPAGQPSQPVHAEDDAAQDITDAHGNGQRHVEITERPRLGLEGEPMVEIINDAGIKARFCRAEDKAHDVQLDGIVDEHGTRGNEAPDEENGGNPAPCPQPGQNDITRQAKEEITDKKEPRAKAIGRRSDAQILIHRQRRDADIGPVYKGNKI